MKQTLKHCPFEHCEYRSYISKQSATCKVRHCLRAEEHFKKLIADTKNTTENIKVKMTTLDFNISTSSINIARSCRYGETMGKIFL